MKKRKNKKFIALMVVAAMLIPNSVYAAGNENSEAKGAEALKNRIEAIKEEQEKFLSSDKMKKQNASNEKHRKIAEKICVGEEYPSYYGGSYLNDEDELVVLLTDKSKEVSDKVREAAGTDDVIIEYADASLEYLKALQDSYSEKYEQLYAQKDDDALFTDAEREIIEGYRGAYITEKTNNLVIKIKEINEEKVKMFKKVFGDNSKLVFEDAGDLNLNVTQWRTGRVMYTWDGGQSTGYRAYYINSVGTRYNGFVTAGHGCTLGRGVYADELCTIYIGECKASAFFGSVDAAFVAITNSGYEPSNVVHYTNSSGSTTGTLITLLSNDIATRSDMVEGASVFSVGCSTFLQSGTICSANASHCEEGTSLTNLIVTDIYTVDGDSGGCLFMRKNAGYVAMGTLIGEGDRSGGFVGSYFSKITSQIAYLGIVKY